MNKTIEVLVTKMQEELKDFRSWLLTQPPERILDYAEEYATKFNLALWLGDWNPDEKEAEVLAFLIHERNPLEIIYRMFLMSGLGEVDLCRLEDKILERVRDLKPLREYEVTITETLVKVVSEMARSEEEAEEAVRKGYREGVYVLDSSNHTETEFSVVLYED